MIEFNPLISKTNFNTKLQVSMWRIIFSRLFDLFCWLLISFLFLKLIEKLLPFKNRTIIFQLILNLFMLFVFILIFVLIPTFYHGQTIGRRIFGIQILTAKTWTSLPFRYFLLRELFLVFLPFITITIYLNIMLHFFPNRIQKHYQISLLLPVWFIFLFIFQKINPNQQIFIDRYYNSWIIKRLSKKQTSKK